MSDDDLPLLTHVLRTGKAPASVSAAVDPALDDGFHDRFDVHPFDEGPLTRQIVIGHEPPRAAGLTAMALYDDDLPPPYDGAADSHANPPVTADDAPPITAAGVHRAPSNDTPIDFSVPSDTAVWAARVREAVMNDLVTRIDTELDARIAQAMHSELETSLARLQEGLRAHLTDALRDVVARAVNEEIIRIRRSNGDAAES